MDPLTLMVYVLILVVTVRNLYHATLAQDDFLRAARQPKALPQTTTGNWEQLPNSPTLNALRSDYKADRIDLITFLSKWEETFKQRVGEIDDWQSIDPWTDRLEPAPKLKKSTKIDKLPAQINKSFRAFDDNVLDVTQIQSVPSHIMGSTLHLNSKPILLGRPPAFGEQAYYVDADSHIIGPMAVDHMTEYIQLQGHVWCPSGWGVLPVTHLNDALVRAVPWVRDARLIDGHIGRTDNRHARAGSGGVYVMDTFSVTYASLR